MLAANGAGIRQRISFDRVEEFMRHLEKIKIKAINTNYNRNVNGDIYWKTVARDHDE